MLITTIRCILKSNFNNNSRVIKDFDEFKWISDVIVANRLPDEIKMWWTRFYTRGIKMNKSIANFILSIGKRIEGPTFIRDFEDCGAVIDELQSIANSIKDEAVQDEINMDIMFIKAGDQGEKNVYYELKNSFIPMLILHDVVIQYDEHKAQMDYILITSKFICILETKKLNGNIMINTDGDFIRSFVNKNGKVYKKEGIYSPVSQNQRHVRILENLLKQEKIIKSTPVLSLVVIANPKSIIDYKYAKKEIKEQIVKYDQLTPRIKKMLSMKSEVNLNDKAMTNIANFLAKKHVESESAFITKYRKHQNTDDLVVETKKCETRIEETISNIPREEAPRGSSVDKESIRIALTKFRLDRSREEKIKPYFIFNNNQLDALLERMPTSPEELLKCEGFGPVKVDKYGEQILKILKLG
jgi:hypothetical protein